MVRAVVVIKESIINNICIREETIEDWYAKHFPKYKIIKTENSFIIVSGRISQKEISSIADSTSSKSNV